MSDKVKLYKNFSENILPELNNSYDFIFIDGCHSSPQVIKEVEYCYKLLNEGGYILFDDYTYIKKYY